MLYQILHTDLRDVVRPISNDDGNAHLASRQLRTAITESIQLQQHVQNNSSSNNTSARPTTVVRLSESFRLLLQIEELLDVSLNAEARWADGPASTHDPTPTGNQRLRCLKACCSDGYDGQPIIAMEIIPIPNLSVHSHAGIKVILHGPIDIRWGILSLHPGNATVLGGQVSELVELQHKAVQQAKRLAGVGMDPTIKALIGTAPEVDENEEDIDVGEGESRDVDVIIPPASHANPTMPQRPVQQYQQQRDMPPPPPPSHRIQATLTTSNMPMGANSLDSSAVGRSNSRYPMANDVMTSAPSTTVARTTPIYSNPYSNIGTAVNANRPTNNTPLVANPSPSVTSGNSSSSINSNPYAGSCGRTNFASTSISMSQQPFIPTASTESPPSSLHVSQRFDSHNNNNNPRGSHVAHNQEESSSDSPSHGINLSSYVSTSPTTAHPQSTPKNTIAASSSSSSSATSLSSSPLNSEIQIMSFENLLKLLQQLLNHQQLYQTFYHRTFEVTMKQKGGTYYFNIEKKKKEDRLAKKRKSKDKNDKVRETREIKGIPCLSPPVFVLH